MKQRIKVLFILLFIFVFAFIFGCKKTQENPKEATEPVKTQETTGKETPVPTQTKTPEPSPTKTETIVGFDEEDWEELFDVNNFTCKFYYLIPFGTYSTDNYYIYHVLENEAFESYYEGNEVIYAKRLETNTLKEKLDGVFNGQLENFTINPDTLQISLFNEYFVTLDGRMLFIHNVNIVLNNGYLEKIIINFEYQDGFSNTCIIDFYDFGTTEAIVPDSEKEQEYLTVSEALDIAMEAGDAGTSDVCYVTGVVSRITNGNYGEMYITDGENELYIYGLYQNDIVYSKLDDKPYSGDTVYVYGILKTYSGNPEMGKAELVKWDKNETPVDLTGYIEMTIKEARESDVDTKVIIKGVVGFITKANGYVPNGIFVIDETECVYIYGLELASRVSVGDEIEVACEKAYYILESEIEYAKKWGYIGSCQMVNPILISQEKKNLDFNKEWIEESTVKDIVNMSVSSNVTTSIFKVNAYINRVPGSGFVNFYINDLDNETGSYCYSLCNGGDFEYLSEFDGKICTVYLSPFNCKSTSSSAFFRFIPVLVLDEGFEFDTKDAPEYAIKYCVYDQFYDKYTSDPELPLITTVSNEALGFDGVSISYTSSDESVINFESKDNGLVMHVLKTGTATITMKATLGDVEVSYDKEIECEVDVEYESITVLEAFNKTDGTIVNVRGVVSASLVNQKGFYLIDDTGMIAVRTTVDELAKVKIGDEVIVSGTKAHYTKDSTKRLGQLLIEDAVLVVNFYGNHEFNKTSCINDKTIDELIDLSKTNDDITGNYYETKLYIKKVASQYSTNYYLTNQVNGSSTIYLYAGSGAQYSWLDSYLDTEITAIFAFTDWNTKTEFRACLIAVVLENGLDVNNLNFR